jgi:apolipoprotein N-acyltransferase
MPTERGPAPAVALALAAGILHTASFAPLEAWPLQVASLALLLVALGRQPTPRSAALAGWLFAFAWLASGMWWLFISLHDYGGLAAPLAALAVALLAALLALYHALALALYARWRSGRPGVDALLFSACWLAAELARAVLFTGFPWIASGYAHTSGPLAGWAPWIGVYGIGALAAWWAAATVVAWQTRTLLTLLPAWGLALAGLALPQDFTRGTGTLSVTLWQPNVPQDLKFDAARVDRTLQWHLDALARSRGTLVVTPESSIPLPLHSLERDYLAALRAPFAQGERAALVGLFTGSETEGYTNSLIGLSSPSDPAASGGFYRYGKRHLLPFGEFIPTGFGWFVRLLNIPIGDQERGRTIDALSVAGQRVRPLICYEDLFAEDIVDSVVGDGAATLFANATNLAWFGSVMVQDQHLQFSRMRALELQRPIVRATNTGATAVIDHRGRVTARLAPLVEGVLDASVEGRIGVTPYAAWLSRLRLWPLAFAAALVFLWAVRSQRATPTP